MAQDPKINGYVDLEFVYANLTHLAWIVGLAVLILLWKLLHVRGKNKLRFNRRAAKGRKTTRFGSSARAGKRLTDLGCGSPACRKKDAT